MPSSRLHEDAAKLNPQTIDRHRAIVSLMEELEAIDWYDQRVEGAMDDTLREILAHNRDEEKEHAAMVLEWLRRADPVLNVQLRAYLFSKGDIASKEEAATGGNTVGEPATDEQAMAPGKDENVGDARGDGSLGIGSLILETTK